MRLISLGFAELRQSLNIGTGQGALKSSQRGRGAPSSVLVEEYDSAEELPGQQSSDTYGAQTIIEDLQQQSMRQQTHEIHNKNIKAVAPINYQAPSLMRARENTAIPSMNLGSLPQSEGFPFLQVTHNRLPVFGRDGSGSWLSAFNWSLFPDPLIVWNASEAGEWASYEGLKNNRQW